MYLSTSTNVLGHMPDTYIHFQREVSGGSKKSNVPSGGGKSRERGTVESLSAGSGM